MLPWPYSLLRMLTGMNKGQVLWSAEYLQCLASLILAQLLRVCVKLNKLLDDVVHFSVVPCIHIQGLLLVKCRNCSRNRNWFFLSFVSVPVTGPKVALPIYSFWQVDLKLLFKPYLSMILVTTVTVWKRDAGGKGSEMERLKSLAGEKNPWILYSWVTTKQLQPLVWPCSSHIFLP